MPTLNAMFKLIDGYSSQINRMISRTDAAMTKMLGASRAADGLSDAIGKTGNPRNLLPRPKAMAMAWRTWGERRNGPTES